ncbi:hypothetical protein I3760_04G179800 [Carya illinoinensis]|nr:hypothetical protein I3760_04G179800 [Carya illinoinensis]
MNLKSHGFGWKYEAEPKHDWSTLIANKNAELQQLTGIYENTLKNAGVTLIEGHGKIVDLHTVDVDGKLYSARQILVSPTKIAIIGGGYIAVEFAGIFNGLTSEVHIFIRQKKVLRGFDEEIRDFVGEQMSLRGIEFHTEESPQAINKSADGSLSLKTNKGTVEGFSHVMFATRRRPNTKVLNFFFSTLLLPATGFFMPCGFPIINLGLETDGVKMSKIGAIEVDEYSRTSVPSIWAVGDVTDRLYLTPVALTEGMALAKTLFKNEPTKPDYRTVPSAVFSSQPPIGQVGITEEKAIQEYGDVDIFKANFKPLKATLSGLPDRIFMKLIVCAKTSKVLGLHLCEEDSPEIVQVSAVAPDSIPLPPSYLIWLCIVDPEVFISVKLGKTDLEAKAAAGVLAKVWINLLHSTAGSVFGCEQACIAIT